MNFTAETFRGIVQTHQGMVFSIALRLIGDYGVAEEIAQDVFLELYRTSEGFGSGDHLRNWLRRVSVHRSTDALRRRSRQPESSADEWIEEQHTPLPPSAPPSSVELEGRMQELLQSLPDPMRLVLVLRYQEDMRPHEIADLVDQPLETVKSNLKRGLGLLRRKAEITMKEYVR